jgi:hypothetical protein
MESPRPWRRRARAALRFWPHVLAVGFLHVGYHRAQFSVGEREHLYQRFLHDPIGASLADPVAAVRLHHLRDADEYLYLAWANAMLGRPVDREYLVEESDPTISLLPLSDAEHLLPYRDFVFQYPPAAVFPILAPALITTDPVLYPYAFGTLAGIAALAIALAGLSTRAHLAGPVSARAYRWLSAVALFLVGVTLETRLDVFAAAAVAVALWAAVTERWAFAGVLLGIGTGLKIYPALLFPVFVAMAFALRDRRKAIACSMTFVSVVVLSCAPAALVSWSGLLHAAELQSARNLQVESVSATVVAWIQLASGAPIETARAFGAREIVAGSSRAIASMCRVVLCLIVLAGTLLPWLAMRERPSEAKALLVDGVATVLAGVWIASPVLSPQYLVWGLPVFLLTSSPLARLLYLIALAVTRIEYPACSPFVSQLAPSGLAIVTIRNCLLVATWAALVRRWVALGVRVRSASPAPLG